MLIKHNEVLLLYIISKLAMPYQTIAKDLSIPNRDK
jgi:hypothetical protein